jgi:hypothetical protein
LHEFLRECLDHNWRFLGNLLLSIFNRLKMGILAWILVPVLLAGLARITFLNPSFARKIVTAGIATGSMMFLIRLTYHLAQQDAFYSSIEKANAEPYDSKMADPRVVKMQSDMDLADGAIFVSEHPRAVREMDRTMRYNIVHSISKAEKQESDEANSFFLCCSTATGVFLVFFVLAYARECLPGENRLAAGRRSSFRKAC